MFTIFDFLMLVGGSAGAVLAGQYGYESYGWPGLFAGVASGAIVGALVGNLPWIVASLWMHFDLKLSSTAKLRQRLDDQYFISHLLIAELVARGEPVERFRDYVTGLVRSDDPSRRQFGLGVAATWFPELVPAPGATSHVSGAPTDPPQGEGPG